LNLSETADLLTAMSAYDRRTIGGRRRDRLAGRPLRCAFGDCLEAVKQHYAEHTEWVMPAHIRRAVREIVQSERLPRAPPRGRPASTGC